MSYSTGCIQKSGHLFFYYYLFQKSHMFCDPLSHRYDHLLQVTNRGLSSTHTGLNESNQEPREWWGQWIKLYTLMSSNYHFHKLNVANAQHAWLLLDSILENYDRVNRIIYKMRL